MKSIATREKSNCRRNSSSLDFNQPFATYATSNSNRRSLNQPTRENSTLWLVKFLQRRRTQNCLTRLHVVFSFYFLCGHLKIVYSALFGFISGKTKNFSRHPRTLRWSSVWQQSSITLTSRYCC